MRKKIFLIYGFSYDSTELEIFAVADNLEDALRLKEDCKSEYYRAEMLEVYANEVID